MSWPNPITGPRLARAPRRLGLTATRCAGHGDVCVAVMATCLGSWLTLLAAWTLGRHLLDRRLLSGWEAEWRANGPLCNGRGG